MDKKYLFGAMFAMTVAFSATTTSCSDNDDPKTEKEQPSADSTTLRATLKPGATT